jgi:hypothetical protein
LISPHLGDQVADVAGELLVGSRAGQGDRCPDATRGVRLAGHPCRELGGPVSREDQV